MTFDGCAGLLLLLVVAWLAMLVGGLFTLLGLVGVDEAAVEIGDTLVELEIEPAGELLEEARMVEDVAGDTLDGLLLATRDVVDEEDMIRELLLGVEGLGDCGELLEIALGVNVVFKHLMLCILPLLSPYSYWEHGFMAVILTLLT